MAIWYCRDNAPTSTIGWSAVTPWAALTVYAAGVLRRQLATPTVGNERVFVCIIAGTSLASEPTWVVTKGAKTAEAAGPTWQELTGQPGPNGDFTNCPTWLAVKNTAPGLGRVIQNNAGTHLFIVSTAGTAGNGAEPSFGTTAGNTTADNTVTWTCIGAVGSFGTWAAPFARYNSAITATWGAAGDTFLLGDDHAETQSSVQSLFVPGTNASPSFTYSIDHTLSLPVTGVKSGAAISSTADGQYLITGICAFDGVTFNCGSGSQSSARFAISTVSGTWIRFDNCAIKKLSTASLGGIAFNFTGGAGIGSRVDLTNTTLQFGNTGDSLNIGFDIFTWRNTASAITGATLPTNLVGANRGVGGTITLEGIDLSALGSGKTLVAANDDASSVYFIDCKFGASVTVASTPGAPSGRRVDVVRSDSAGTGYNHQRYWYEGTLTTEPTIVRTGGASDGTTPIAWKIVTTANSKWILPFESFPISIWNTTTASNVTVTLYGIWGGGAVPNDDDIWMDVQYLGASGSPLASVATSTKASNLVTASALSSDSSTWGGSTTKFKMSVLLSTPQPQLAGYLRIYVKAAKASSTFYIDPKPVLS